MELAGTFGNIQERKANHLETGSNLLAPQLDPRERVGKTPQQLTRVPPMIATRKRWQLSNHKILTVLQSSTDGPARNESKQLASRCWTHRWTHASETALCELDIKCRAVQRVETLTTRALKYDWTSLANGIDEIGTSRRKLAELNCQRGKALRIQLGRKQDDEANNNREHEVDTAVPKIVAAEYQ